MEVVDCKKCTKGELGVSVLFGNFLGTIHSPGASLSESPEELLGRGDGAVRISDFVPKGLRAVKCTFW